MGRVLLLGSSFSAVPFLVRLQRMGFFVAVCGKYPSDPCHESADLSHYIDYSDPESVLAVAEQGNYKFIVPTCNDASYLAGAYVSERLGLPGYDSLSTAKILHLKSDFRKFTAGKNISAPMAITHRKGEFLRADSLRFPVLTKPVDNFSGNGITLVYQRSELEDACDKAFQVTRQLEILLEEYVEGTLHSHSAFIVDGNIIIDFFVDEFCTVYNYQVNCSNHPSRLSVQICVEVRATIQRLVGELNIVNGLLHTQFIQNGVRHWIIESMRRCPGDLYGLLIEKSTGVDYFSYYLDGFLGRDSSPVDQSQERYIARHTLSTNCKKLVSCFSHSIPSDNVSFVPLKSSGCLLHAAPVDKLAILFAEFKARDLMEEITPNLDDFISISD